MEYTWKPDGIKMSEFEEFSDYFEGYVKLKIKNRHERLKLALGLQTVVDKNKEIAENSNMMDQNEKIVKLLEDHVIELKLKSGDFEMNSLDDLGMFKQGETLILELFKVCTGGIPLGKLSKGKSSKPADS